jgi:hypothetical protein
MGGRGDAVNNQLPFRRSSLGSAPRFQEVKVTTFLAQINPLAFLQIDEPRAPKDGSLPSYEDVLRFVCSPESSDLESLIDRYRRTSIESQRLFAAPAEKNIMEKLIWPLKHARSSYMVSNFLGTISLCGMVAEMVSILVCDISNVRINGKQMDEELQRSLFGSSFERLGQERRVSILRGYDLIDDQTKARFDLVREKRRRYLHFFSQEHINLMDDAVKVFDATVVLVASVIGQDIDDGKIVLNASLMKYLEDHGIVQKTDMEMANEDGEAT